MTDRLPTVEPLAATRLAAALRHRMDRKTKPLGSLGRLEALAVQIGCVLGTEQPALQSPQLVVFAADHGLAARGVSAFPSDVTWQMVENFLAGGAAVSVLARQHGLALTVVDAGVNHDFTPRAGLLDRKVARGTADASVGPAMTAAQCDQALRAGASIVRELPGNVVMFGEMGIGNTSSASLLLSRLTGAPLADCVGRGTGLDDAGLARKLDVRGKALSLHDGVTDPLALMACVGGFEIAMMAGAVLQAAAERRVILVDGFITGAAVLWAARVAPAVLERCIWAHSSAEPGHRVMTKYLGVEPLLDLGMRLGEGSGAALAWPLLVSAVQLLREMASFESAGVSDAGTA
jgi:nicotinate-nucleotide--dimethylbenzimidazole phosphoribosyltransferase